MLVCGFIFKSKAFLYSVEAKIFSVTNSKKLFGNSCFVAYLHYYINDESSHNLKL